MIVFGAYSTPGMNRFLVETAKKLCSTLGANSFFLAWSSDARKELEALGMKAACYPSPALRQHRGHRDAEPPWGIVSCGYDSAWIGEVANATPGYWGTELDRRHEIRAALALAETVFTLLKPQLLVLWNGEHAGSRALRFVAGQVGVPVLFIERGPLADTLLVDAAGVNAHASFANALIGDVKPSALEWAKTRVETYLGGNESAWQQPEDRQCATARLARVARGRRLVFLPLQVSSDTNMVLHSPLFRTSSEFAQEVITAYQAHADYHLVIKNHPLDPYPVAARQLRKLHNWTLLDRLSVKDILPLCDHVVTNNSTVGLEALLYDKPVIQTGHAYYGNKGLTIQVDAIADLQQAIRRVASETESGRQHSGALRLLASLRSHQHLFDLRIADDIGAFCSLIERSAANIDGRRARSDDVARAVCMNAIMGLYRTNQFSGLFRELARTVPFRLATALRGLPLLQKYRRFLDAANGHRD